MQDAAIQPTNQRLPARRAEPAPTAAPQPPFASDAQRLESFGRALDALRREVEEQLGEADAQHIKRVGAASRGLALLGRGLLYVSFEPVGFEVGFSYAEDSGSIAGADLDTEVWEIYGGVRKTFSLADDRLHPFLSAGASWSNAELDVSSGLGSGDVDDDAFGFYLRAGAYYTFGDGFNLGLDYRKLLGADYSDSGVDADGEFDQLSVSIGYSF